MTNIKQFIRSRDHVSQIQWDCFQFFPLVLKKNKDSFAGLFETINYILMHGKQDLQGSQRQQLKVLAQMAETALITQTNARFLKNSEGAILIQLML